MKLKFEMTKKNMLIGVATVSAFGLVTYSYLATNREEAIIAKEEVTESSESTVESTTESSEVEEEKESIISKISEFTYDTIQYQSELIIASNGNSSDIYNKDLEVLNSFSDFEQEKNDLAHTLKTDNSVYAKTYNQNPTGSIFSVYVNQSGELETKNIGLKEENEENLMLGVSIANKYDVFPYSRMVDDRKEVNVDFHKNQFRSKSFTANYGGNGVGGINSSGNFIITQTFDRHSSKNFLKIKNANAQGDDGYDNSTTKEITFDKLINNSDINDRNRVLLQQFTDKSSDGKPYNSIYDLESDTTYDFPIGVSLMLYGNTGINMSSDFPEIGEADAFPYVFIDENYNPNATPKVGIISITGEVLIEPSLFNIGKPNKNGIAPFQEELNGKWGIINVNTGEVIKETYADKIENFNKNGLSIVTQNSKATIIDEKGNVREATDYVSISELNEENIASYREYESGKLGILKVNVE